MNNVYQPPQADLTLKKEQQGSDPVTQEMIDGLANGRKWAMFLAVLGYIQLGFIGLALVFMIFVLFNAGLAALFGILIYGVIGYIIFKITRFVHQYSTAVRDFEERGSQGYLLDSQEFYTGFIKWIGYILILTVVLMIIGFIFGAAFG